MGNSVLNTVEEIISELEHSPEKIMHKGAQRSEEMANGKERLKSDLSGE